MKFNKSNMAFEFDYSWRDPQFKTTKLSAIPDNSPFNKNSGDEVLFLLNWFNFQNLIEFAKAERMIKYYLPQNITTQKDVEKWIIHNWANPEYS